MSRSYHRVYPAIWDEPWDDDTRYVALYLLTCRHRRMEGIYRLPWPYVLVDIGWQEARLQRAWDALVDHGFIEYDRAVGVVWIVKAMEKQPPDNTNQRKAVIKAVRDLPPSPLINRFQQVARGLHEQFVEGFPEHFGDSPAPTPAPVTALSASADVARIEDRKPPADVQAVFDAWLDSTGKDRKRTRLDPKRRRKITAALKLYPVEDVVDAVKGWRASPHHRGENDTGTVYNDIDLLLRDAAHIEKFRDLQRQSSSGRTDDDQLARINAGLKPRTA